MKVRITHARERVGAIKASVVTVVCVAAVQVRRAPDLTTVCLRGTGGMK
jgi:hypothetical protein